MLHLQTRSELRDLGVTQTHSWTHQAEPHLLRVLTAPGAPIGTSTGSRRSGYLTPPGLTALQKLTSPAASGQVAGRPCSSSSTVSLSCRRARLWMQGISKGGG